MRILSGKMVLGGLGVMLCAKAALSFPILPLFDLESLGPDQYLVRTAAAEKTDKGEEKSKPIEAAKDAPPLVEDLPQKMASNDTPEAVLRSLARERELVEAQKQEIAAQKAELALAQERLAVERQSLTELKDSIEGLLARVEAAQTEDLNRLIDFYKNMKPADAARIMNDMDIETTIMIMGTMNPRIAAPIMAEISPVRARAISKIILERSQLPGDQDLRGIKLN